MHEKTRDLVWKVSVLKFHNGVHFVFHCFNKVELVLLQLLHSHGPIGLSGVVNY